MTEWTEIRFGTHDTTYRWRCREFDGWGKPLQLEMESKRQGEWREVRPTNFLDGFRLGMMAARANVQTELSL